MNKAIAVYCAWCKKRMKGCPVGYYTPYVSHGICHDCLEDVKDDLKNELV